jgi:hypothetical protein
VSVAAPRRRPAPAERWGPWAAFAICALFFALQAGALDYGTTINNLPHIARYQIKDPGAAASAVQRRNLILDKTTYQESLDKQMLRYKLYSVESDEVINIMVLSRMRPGVAQLDPGFFLYGGAYIYPLGLWYFALQKLGVIEVGSLAAMAANPERMDAIYMFGRLFVLIVVTLSGLVLFAAARRLVPARTACMMLMVYYAAPATVMFSQTMKPHWYAMLWVNIAILMVVRAYIERRFGWGAAVITGAALGLAVGSAQTFALFAVLVWIALVLAVRRGHMHWGHLASVPAIAILAFAITNPYVLINWEGYLAERNDVASNWFRFTLDPKFLWRFVAGSLAPGMGIAFAGLLLAVSAWRALRGGALERWVAGGVFLSVVVVGYLTAALSAWHINLRYAPYLLSAGVLFLGVCLGARRNVWLGACVVLTVLQAAPMWLAYRDEDSATRSTRLSAARWIDANLPAGTGLFVGTGQPAPYEVPPFDLARYRINARDWAYQVAIERQADRTVTPKGTELVKRFTPRLSARAFPFVYSHINPQISVYRRRDKPASP